MPRPSIRNLDQRALPRQIEIVDTRIRAAKADVERLPGSTRLQFAASSGGGTVTLRSMPESGLISGGAWIVVGPTTAYCEVFTVDSTSGLNVVLDGTLANDHAADAPAIILSEPVLKAPWFSSLLGAINGTPDGFTLVIPSIAQTLSSWTTPTVSSKTITLKSDNRGAAQLVGPDTSTDFINLGDGANITVEKLYFQTWQDVFKLTNSTTAISVVELNNITFTGVVKAVNAPNTVQGVTRLVIENCRVLNSVTGGNSRGILFQAPFSEAYIARNRFSSIKNRAIELGENTYADQDNWQKAIITGNHIQGVTGTTEAQGILVFGAFANISHNVVDTVLSDDGTDAEGIYTKCRYANISNNTLIDAGRLDGFINVKGAVRAGTAAPQGYTVQVRGNTLIETRAQDSRAIHVVNDDVVVSGNQVEGNFRYGITLAAVALNNISIRGNEFTNCGKANFWAIECLNTGSGITIDGNKVNDIGAGTSNPCGVRITPDSGTISRIRIRNNDFYDISGSATASNAGLYLVGGGGTITGAEIIGNTFDTVYNAAVFDSSNASDIRISGNKFSNVTGAVFTNLTSVDGYDVYDNRGYTPPTNGIDFTNLDETPSVKNKNAFYRANYDAATNVTDFDDGVNGQRITVYFFTSNVTLVHGASTINLHGNTNYNVPADSWMEFICRNDAWYELTRSND